MIRRLTRFLMLSPRELGTLLLLFACSLPAVTARLYSSDEVEYFSYLRSLWFDHDVSFENEYQYFYDHDIAQSADFHQTFLELTTPAGRRINYGTIGCAILWAPFYAAGDVRCARSTRGRTRRRGRRLFAPVRRGRRVRIGVLRLRRDRARRSRRRDALVGAGALGSGLAVWVGTPLLFYMYIAPPFSHACSAFAVALLRHDLAARPRSVDRRGAARSASPAHWWPWCASRTCSSRSRRRSTILVTVAAQWADGRDGKRVGRASAPRARGVRGVCHRVPAAVARIPGAERPTAALRAGHTEDELGGAARAAGARVSGTRLFLLDAAGRSRHRGARDPHTAWRRDGRRVGAGLLLMVALQVYVSGAVESWTVAGAFGQRRFVSITMILVVGLAAVAACAQRRGGRPRSRSTRQSRSRLVEHRVDGRVRHAADGSPAPRARPERVRCVRDAAAMAPDLVYRYLTHRSSFYKPPPPPPQDRQ